MQRWPLVLAFVLIGSLGCFLNACGKDNSGQIAGPGVSVHCNALEPRGIGDTSVRVTCPPAAQQVQDP